MVLEHDFSVSLCKIFPHAESQERNEIKENRDGYIQNDLNLLHLVAFVLSVTILSDTDFKRRSLWGAGKSCLFPVMV